MPRLHEALIDMVENRSDTLTLKQDDDYRQTRLVVDSGNLIVEHYERPSPDHDLELLSSSIVMSADKLSSARWESTLKDQYVPYKIWIIFYKVEESDEVRTVYYYDCSQVDVSMKLMEQKGYKNVVSATAFDANGVPHSFFKSHPPVFSPN